VLNNCTHHLHNTLQCSVDLNCIQKQRQFVYVFPYSSTSKWKPYRYCSTPKLYIVYQYVLYCFFFAPAWIPFRLRLKKSLPVNDWVYYPHNITLGRNVYVSFFFGGFPSTQYFRHRLSHKGGIWTGYSFVFFPPLQLTTAAHPTKQPFSVLDYHTHTHPFQCLLVTIITATTVVVVAVIVVVVVVRVSLITFLSVTFLRKTLQTPTEYITPDCNWFQSALSLRSPPRPCPSAQTIRAEDFHGFLHTESFFFSFPLSPEKITFHDTHYGPAASAIAAAATYCA